MQWPIFVFKKRPKYWSILAELLIVILKSVRLAVNLKRIGTIQILLYMTCGVWTASEGKLFKA